MPTEPDPSTPLPRAQFPVLERHVPLNHAGVGPLPRAAVEAMGAVAEEASRLGGPAYDRWEVRAEEVRASLARLLGVTATEVAFVKNTTEGLAFVAAGLDWAPGDRVLVADREFPSTVYPWLGLADRGVAVDMVSPVGPYGALPTEVFAAALAARPARVVCVSWVQFASGWVLDLPALAAICHDHGALLVVDAIQGLGVLPAAFADWDVDVAVAGAHKWLLGPMGVGTMFVAARHLDRIRPVEPGWASVAHREAWDDLRLVLDDTARRYEGGTANLAGIAGLGASVDLLLSGGLDRIWAHVDGCCGELAAAVEARGLELLGARGAGATSPMVTYRLPGADDAWAADHAAALGELDVLVAPRGGGVRLAPHGYLTAEDIARFLTALDAVLHHS